MTTTATPHAPPLAPRTTADDGQKSIAFQGFAGAYSDLACREAYPHFTTLACASFEDVFDAVQREEAALGMIPVDNTVAGRVADIHHLLPASELFIIGEHFLRINHQLLALPGVALEEIQTVSSHIHALNQCRGLIRQLGLKPRIHADTAGAASALAASQQRQEAVIASSLAAQIYGLHILRSDIEDATHNTTRFLVMAKEPRIPPCDDKPAMTSLMFRVRNIPAALYKALGGFATNGVNMTKLESYIGSNFAAAQFYADIEGHCDEPKVRLAMEELQFFAKEIKLLGTYPISPYRYRWREQPPSF